jgi:multisubunit Na+/H+ antiporter MnhB subunit
MARKAAAMDEILFDVLVVILGALITGSAGWALFSRSIFRSVVMFVVYGLFISIMWSLLRAPDVALAEAAIGAGVTGALFIRNIDIGRSFRVAERSWERGSGSAAVGIVGIGISALCVATIAGASIASLLSAQSGLTAAVAGSLPRSGVDQPVTAVLLNFRAYDTWVEMFVLFAALVGAIALRGEVYSSARSSTDVSLNLFVHALVPIAVLSAGYLLWAGSFRAGGAFQSGAVLGALLILIFTASERAMRVDFLYKRWRWLASAACLSFLALALIGLLQAGTLLRYPVPIAGALILVVETFSALAIAFTLLSLFSCAMIRGGSN